MLIVHLICEVPRSISNSHGPSRFQMSLLHPASTASILLRLLLLLAVSCYIFHSFITLVALFLIKMLLVSIFLLVLGKLLLVIYKSTCPKNYIPAVMPPLNHTSLPSMVATFLATRLMVVLQPSGYSVFHGGDTPIQLSLP